MTRLSVVPEATISTGTREMTHWRPGVETTPYTVAMEMTPLSEEKVLTNSMAERAMMSTTSLISIGISLTLPVATQHMYQRALSRFPVRLKR